MTYNVFGGTLSLTQSINQSFQHERKGDWRLMLKDDIDISNVLCLNV